MKMLIDASGAVHSQMARKIVHEYFAGYLTAAASFHGERNSFRFAAFTVPPGSPYIPGGVTAGDCSVSGGMERLAAAQSGKPVVTRTEFPVTSGFLKQEGSSIAADRCAKVLPIARTGHQPGRMGISSRRRSFGGVRLPERNFQSEARKPEGPCRSHRADGGRAARIETQENQKFPTPN